MVLDPTSELHEMTYKALHSSTLEDHCSSSFTLCIGVGHFTPEDSNSGEPIEGIQKLGQAQSLTQLIEWMKSTLFHIAQLHVIVKLSSSRFC